MWDSTRRGFGVTDNNGALSSSIITMLGKTRVFFLFFKYPPRSLAHLPLAERSHEVCFFPVFYTNSDQFAFKNFTRNLNVLWAAIIACTNLTMFVRFQQKDHEVTSFAVFHAYFDQFAFKNLTWNISIFGAVIVACTSLTMLIIRCPLIS